MSGIIGFDSADAFHTFYVTFHVSKPTPSADTDICAVFAPYPASLKVWSLEFQSHSGSGMLKASSYRTRSWHSKTVTPCNLQHMYSTVYQNTFEYFEDWCLIWLHYVISYILTNSSNSSSPGSPLPKDLCSLRRIKSSRRSLRATWWTPVTHSLFHMESGNKMDENAWKWNHQPFGISEALRSPWVENET